jgi:hypothetical protein
MSCTALGHLFGTVFEGVLWGMCIYMPAVVLLIPFRAVLHFVSCRHLSLQAQRWQAVSFVPDHDRGHVLVVWYCNRTLRRYPSPV